MKTRMTELLGIKHPIMLAGMAFVSLPKLVWEKANQSLDLLQRIL